MTASKPPLAERVDDTDLSELYMATVMAKDAGFRQVSCDCSTLILLLAELRLFRAGQRSGK